MNSETVRSGSLAEGTYVRLRIPLGDAEAFRHRATADVLHVLVDNPDREFTNRELHRVTGRGMGGVNAAVDTLEALGVITIDRSGRANAVKIAPEMLIKPADPVTIIPQSEYHAPVREIIARLEDHFESDIGVVLFGSVARGTADRTSDIDLFVVIDKNRMQAQRQAHTIEQSIADERIDGERYKPHIVVETRDSAPTHDHITDILAEGVTLHSSPALHSVKQEVFENGVN